MRSRDALDASPEDSVTFQVSLSVTVPVVPQRERAWRKGTSIDKRSKRRLNPIDGFYERKKVLGGKMPYSISMKDCSPFVFAGLWEGWKDPLNCGWLDVIQRDKHSLNSQEHSAEPNWNIALFRMKR
jgi:putative SOS response-associated peptidase YedK